MNWQFAGGPCQLRTGKMESRSGSGAVRTATIRHSTPSLRITKKAGKRRTPIVDPNWATAVSTNATSGLMNRIEGVPKRGAVTSDHGWLGYRRTRPSKSARRSRSLLSASAVNKLETGFAPGASGGSFNAAITCPMALRSAVSSAERPAANARSRQRIGFTLGKCRVRTNPFSSFSGQ